MSRCCLCVFIARTAARRSRSPSPMRVENGAEYEATTFSEFASITRMLGVEIGAASASTITRPPRISDLKLPDAERQRRFPHSVCSRKSLKSSRVDLTPACFACSEDSGFQSGIVLSDRSSWSRLPNSVLSMLMLACLCWWCVVTEAASCSARSGHARSALRRQASRLRRDRTRPARIR